MCCDGTGNEYGDNNTKRSQALFQSCPKMTTGKYRFMIPASALQHSLQRLQKPSGPLRKSWVWLSGGGITANIADAYRFLMRTYERGDRVFLFGFSRGAYTVRAVAAMLYKCGLLDQRNDNLLPYALNLFRHEMRPRIYAGFRRTFSRQCPVHFLGIWDTVKSVGWIYDPLTLQFTRNNPCVRVVRHAVAIDERRCFYRQNLWGSPDAGQDVKQAWFAGSHSDVGGPTPKGKAAFPRLRCSG